MTCFGAIFANNGESYQWGFQYSTNVIIIEFIEQKQLFGRINMKKAINGLPAMPKCSKELFQSLCGEVLNLAQNADILLLASSAYGHAKEIKKTDKIAGGLLRAQASDGSAPIGNSPISSYLVRIVGEAFDDAAWVSGSNYAVGPAHSLEVFQQEINGLSMRDWVRVLEEVFGKICNHADSIKTSIISESLDARQAKGPQVYMCAEEQLKSFGAFDTFVRQSQRHLSAFHNKLRKQLNRSVGL